MQAAVVIRRALAVVGVTVAVPALLVLLYVGLVLVTSRFAVAAASGTRAGLAVDAPVTIARDERGIAHIRAATDHDLFFADGYAMAADRLFQMDLTRRFVTGRLAEVIGSPMLAMDRRMRRYAVARLAARDYAKATPEEHALLDAFADGVNAAAAREPLPPEYRALFFRFEPWRPEDALAVGFASVLDLDDTADEIVPRQAIDVQRGRRVLDALYPLGDPRYAVPLDGRAANLPTLPALPALDRDPSTVLASPVRIAAAGDDAAATGSNVWAAGADRTSAGRAILANDPHLMLGVPAVWWLLEARSPHFHVAGAALVGTPGVTLGHDEHVAWGVTSGCASAMRLLREPLRASHGDEPLLHGDEVEENGRWVRLQRRIERIGVRFGRDVLDENDESVRGTVLKRGQEFVRGRPVAYAYLMSWPAQLRPASPMAPFLALNRAASAPEAVASLRLLEEPSLNVAIADDAGRAAYQFAGQIPQDDAWAMHALDGDRVPDAVVPFERLPHVDPSRTALVVSANNRPGGNLSPRLGPAFPPPYRAFAIRSALTALERAHGKLTPDDIASEQHDDASPAEAEFARLVLAAVDARRAADWPALRRFVAALRTFDGHLEPSSRGATAVVAARFTLTSWLAYQMLPGDLAPQYLRDATAFEVLLRALRERPRGWVPADDYDGFIVTALNAAAQQVGDGEIPRFGTYAALALRHPLAPLGFTLWNGPTLPGRGGSYAPAVQWGIFGQSFRAVWIAGDWDNGTIDIDAGESGEPGSPHYTDESAGWIAFERHTLPFSDAAVRAATRSTLTLTR